MAKTVYFAAVYETMEDYRKTPLMLEFFYYGFDKAQYWKLLGIESYSPDKIIFLTMCPGYPVTQGMAFVFAPIDGPGFSLANANDARDIFGNIPDSPTLIAYTVDDNNEIKELGRLVGDKTGPEVFAWASSFYSSSSWLPVAAVAVAAGVAYKYRSRLKKLVNA